MDICRARLAFVSLLLLIGLGTVGLGSASAASILPTAELLPGRGDGRVEVTKNGRFAIVHQGSSYDPHALIKLDLRSSPARVLGSTHVPAQTDGALALSGNRFAYTTHDKELWVTDIRAATPRTVRKVGFGIDGSAAKIYDIVVSPNGRFAYATANNWIHTPGTHLLVMRIAGNGLPRLLRRVPLEATHLAISRDGRRLIAGDGRRAQVLDLRRPANPRRLGRPIAIPGDVRALSFGRAAHTAYALSAGRAAYRVSRIAVNRGRVTQRRTFAGGSFVGAGGGLTVSANGRHVVVTNSEITEEAPSVWLLTAALRPRANFTGPCFPHSVAASLGGPTRGLLLVADSGICEQARVWRIRP